VRRCSGVFVSELLVTEPTEGSQVMAGELGVHFSGGHGYTLFGPSRIHGSHTSILSARSIGLRAIARLLGSAPRHVVYMPSSGLTLAAFLRIAVLRLAGAMAVLEVVITQVHISRRMQRLVYGACRMLSVQFTVATLAQAKAAEEIGLRPRLLSPRVPPNKVSTRSKVDARRLLKIPLDSIVYLHVGHAKLGRNLTLLEGLSGTGHILVVVSSRFPEEEGSLPTGERVTILRGPQPALADLYAAADVYVFPTTAANSVIGIPMSVMESLANGTPVVAIGSEMLERWSELEGLYLCQGEQSFLETARRVAASRQEVYTSNPKFLVAGCRGDFFSCRA
jgi:hypothetical protein